MSTTVAVTETVITATVTETPIGVTATPGSEVAVSVSDGTISVSLTSSPITATATSGSTVAVSVTETPVSITISPSGASEAVNVSIVDAGSFYTGIEVETALQEIGDGTTLDARYVNVTGDTMTGNLGMGANNITMTGSLAATGARVLKGWFTDVESTNMYTVGGTSIQTTFDSRYLQIANDLSDLNNAATARTNLGLVAGGAGDIWVEKAGDILTGNLIYNDNIKALFGTDSNASILHNNVDLIIDPNEVGTGGVVIEPTSDATSIFSVNKADSTVVFNVDTTNARVGVGTATPQELLHVGAGTDASDITATDLLVTRAGPSNLSVRVCPE